jgi:hypothetical protein
VQDYNVTVRSFPSNLTAMVFGHKEKPQFTVENEREIAKPPSVDFGTAPGASRDRDGSARTTSPPGGGTATPPAVK